jgi:hypothetical protein
MFWANLAGIMESIDAGTTTALDHAHMNWSKDFSQRKTMLTMAKKLKMDFEGRYAIAGIISSGIRSSPDIPSCLSSRTHIPRLNTGPNHYQPE